MIFYFREKKKKKEIFFFIMFYSYINFLHIDISFVFSNYKQSYIVLNMKLDKIYIFYILFSNIF